MQIAQANPSGPFVFEILPRSQHELSLKVPSSPAPPVQVSPMWQVEVASRRLGTFGNWRAALDTSHVDMTGGRAKCSSLWPPADAYRCSLKAGSTNGPWLGYWRLARLTALAACATAWYWPPQRLTALQWATGRHQQAAASWARRMRALSWRPIDLEASASSRHGHYAGRAAQERRSGAARSSWTWRSR